MTDTNETPDDVDVTDQSETDSDDQNRELRTDGGTVATESVNSSHPNGTVTPESTAEQGTPRVDTTTVPQTDPSPDPNEPPATNDPEKPTNSEPNEVRNGDELFSGAVPVNDILDFYLETNPWGVAEGTISSYRTRLRHFRQFCAEEDIENLREIQPSRMDEFHNYLRKQPQIGARSSIKGCLSSLRKFIRYCERRGVVDRGFHELIILPTLSDSKGDDETWLPRDDAKDIVAHLAKFEPFSKAHVIWVLLAETGIRQSTLYAFDLDDYDATERYIEAVNREDTGTRLKNGAKGERELSISSEAVQVLDGYIQANRNAVTDEYDRDPLLTTRNGRLQKSTIRKYVYAWSRPCAIGKDCPVEKEPETCEAAQTNNDAYKCPESVSPHPIRRGYITHLRANGVPTEDVISKRCDANPDTIERWYDMSTKAERREARRAFVEDL
ncbi:Site-specific recombinase XerD [Halopenitus malekzadehii]|uniref:Site-specific recombinase XerD n=1 Tax=Halopenitus malekzadehii TaxID=1267564 RepID=A0A1H6ICP5_9EURY|nr:site-specific integrase [Halopenitus malekzadehii]SEH45583.1 Site-specific recombinase XerD [Halopenitus malekzadehii]